VKAFHPLNDRLTTTVFNFDQKMRLSRFSAFPVLDNGIGLTIFWTTSRSAYSELNQLDSRIHIIDNGEIIEIRDAE
jgi:hypothetical protein